MGHPDPRPEVCLSMEAGNVISGHGSRNLDLGPDVVSVGDIHEPLAWLAGR